MVLPQSFLETGAWVEPSYMPLFLGGTVGGAVGDTGKGCSKIRHACLL